MKSVWFAAGLMALVLVFCFALNHALSTSVNEMLDHLDEGEWLADHDDFEGARHALLSAFSLWEEKTPLFSMAFSARHTGEVTAAMHGLREQLVCQDYKNYKAGNARLVAALEEIAAGIHINWENVM